MDGIPTVTRCLLLGGAMERENLAESSTVNVKISLPNEDLTPHLIFLFTQSHGKFFKDDFQHHLNLLRDFSGGNPVIPDPHGLDFTRHPWQAATAQTRWLSVRHQFEWMFFFLYPNWLACWKLYWVHSEMLKLVIYLIIWLDANFNLKNCKVSPWTLQWKGSCVGRVLLVRHQKPSEKSRTSNISVKTYWFQPISPPPSGTLHPFTLGTPPKPYQSQAKTYNMRSLNLKKTLRRTRWTKHKTQQFLLSLISFCIFCFFPATVFVCFPSTSATVGCAPDSKRWMWRLQTVISARWNWWFWLLWIWILWKVHMYPQRI